MRATITIISSLLGILSKLETIINFYKMIEQYTGMNSALIIEGLQAIGVPVLLGFVVWHLYGLANKISKTAKYVQKTTIYLSEAIKVNQRHTERMVDTFVSAYNQSSLLTKMSLEKTPPDPIKMKYFEEKKRELDLLAKELGLDEHN